MQNKANLPDIQMNVSYVKTKNCEQPTWTMNQQNKAKQSQIKGGKWQGQIYRGVKFTNIVLD
jgi:hypothetical protein